MTRAQRFTADAMVGASSLGTLVAGVSVINPDIRSQIASAMGGDASQLTAVASHALEFVHTYTRVAGDSLPFLDNTPLVGFGILALVLTVMMVRTS
jgi:hypothetical protein